MNDCNVTDKNTLVPSNPVLPQPSTDDQNFLSKLSEAVLSVFNNSPVYPQVQEPMVPQKTEEQEKTGLQDTKGSFDLFNKLTNPYSPVGQQALDFARQKLKEHPEIVPEKFCAGYKGYAGTHQPVNKEIALLTGLYYDVFYKPFEEALKQNKKDPWSHQEVIDAADALMKVSFAISILTLEDLPAFTFSLIFKAKIRTYAGALTEQDSYQYRTFYYCTRMYHSFRGAVVWGTKPYRIPPEEGVILPDDIKADHAQRFYEKGTKQHEWNTLYNEYCDRIRTYVSEATLRSWDKRHANWTERDDGPETFRDCPDTMPT